MSRRVPLPGADELFRPTAPPPSVDRPEDWGGAAARPAVSEAPARGTPRQKHTAKITVYVSDAELLALEHARLALRAEHGVAVDRGRVVREAIAVMLADLDAHGEDSVLVRRLRRDSGQ